MSSLPQNLVSALESQFGRLTHVRPVGGGDTSPAVSAQTERAGRVFVKYSDGAAGETYAAEADGLAALRERVTVAGLETRLLVPEPLAHAQPNLRSPGYLVLPWLEGGAATAADWVSFGESLAAVHAVERFGESRLAAENRNPYGWPRDNFLGPETQVNTPCDNWVDFYRDHRLRAMADRMRERGRWLPKWDRLLDSLSLKLPDYLPMVPQPALLHGDFWSGNAMALEGGRFALIDPAVYRGHREVDLALTELFGGFPKAFYDGYYSGEPQAPDYAERRDLYQLYYLIMHLGISVSYGSRVEAILRRY